MSLAAETVQELEEMSNKELLDFIRTSNAPEALALLHERRCAFWRDYRSAICELQHLVLEKNREKMRDKIGELMDRAQWILAAELTPDEPLGGLLIDRLRDATTRVKRLRKQLYATENVLRLDDEILSTMNGQNNIQIKSKRKR